MVNFCSCKLLCLAILGLLLKEVKAQLGFRSVKYVYIGCFNDCMGGVRDLTGLAEAVITKFGSITLTAPVSYSFRSPSMTLDVCASFCALGTFNYMGAQYAEYCFCGNSYGSQGIATQCNMQCPGNTTQICGDGGKNSVFALTYLNNNVFVLADRSFVTFSSYPSPSFWQSRTSRLVECLFQCNIGCLAVIFSLEQSTCYFLKFAVVPSSLQAVSGDFFVKS